jgi:CubicO group peptidase (beta-lactamase class C family)
MRYRIALWFLTIVLIRAWADPVYSTPQFTDPNRLERVKAALPLLDALYRDYAISNHIPGFIYGVMLDGRLIHQMTYGTADLETSIPVEPDTRFRIASMSKSFTALAILKLRDAGKLSLEDPVAKHLREFRKVSPPTSDSPVVTIRHLMRMSVGLPQDDPWADRKLAESDAELDELVARGLTFSNPPGIRWEYSNLGFALLGRIVTKVSRQPYQQYITKEIFMPLGMTNTVWEFDRVPGARLAKGYRWEHEKWTVEPMLHDGAWGSMGGLITTLPDFSRYVAMHLDAWPPRDGKESPPAHRATLREMHRPADIITVPADATIPRVAGYSYGLSWNQDARGVIWVRHAGGLPGFGSEYRFLPDYGLGLIAFANRTYAPMTVINNKAMDLLITNATLLPRAQIPSTFLKKRSEQLARILQNWNAPDVTDALSSNFFLDRSAADWREDTENLIAKTGPIQSTSAVVPENQLRGKFNLVGTKGSIEVFFTMNPEPAPRIQEVKLTFKEPVAR